MRRQIEQFQRMSQWHGGTSGGFDAGGGAAPTTTTATPWEEGGDRWRRQRGEVTEEEMIAELVGRDEERGRNCRWDRWLRADNRVALVHVLYFLESSSGWRVE